MALSTYFKHSIHCIPLSVQVVHVGNQAAILKSNADATEVEVIHSYGEGRETVAVDELSPEFLQALLSI